MRRLALALLFSPVFFGCPEDDLGKLDSQIKVEPLSIELGATAIGVLKKHEVTITNVGAVQLEVSAVALVEETGVPFSLDLSAVAAKETPMKLAPGEKVIVEIRHIPRDRVLDSGVLRISSDAADSPNIEVPISQTGSGAPEIRAVGDVEQADAEADTPAGVSSSVTSIPFGMVPLGQRRTQTLYLVNSGDGNIPLAIESIGIAEASSAEGLTIAADPDPMDSDLLLPALGAASRASPIRSAAVAVSWEPPASGAGLEAVLRIRSSDPATPVLDIPITGGSNTQNPPILRLTPPAGLTFQSLPVGQSAMLTFTAHNDGGSVLVISPLSILNDTNAAFGLAETPAEIQVQPSTATMFTVRYTPPNGAMHMAAVAIATNDPMRASVSYPLNGNGTMSCTPSVPDPNEGTNNDCATAINRGSFALDIDMQQSADWTDSMLYDTGDSDWNLAFLPVIAGCKLTGYDIDARVTLPAGEQAEVCILIGDCTNPFRQVCGMGSSGTLILPFGAGPMVCDQYMNNLPVYVQVRHTAGTLSCTNYSLNFSAR